MGVGQRGRGMHHMRRVGLARSRLYLALGAWLLVLLLGARWCVVA